jgi:hypothetical protein
MYYALFTLIRKQKALADTIATTSSSFDETSSMTTTFSSRRRRDSSTIPTPRIHSSNQLNNSNTNTRRSKKLILESNDIILEPQIDHKNVNPTIPAYTLHQSEQLIERKYTDLLINFFETHQPTYIFEPLRKEYYWTDEPFDDEKITRLEKYV